VLRSRNKAEGPGRQPDADAHGVPNGKETSPESMLGAEKEQKAERNPF
jgi:hypothetical protein